MKLGFCTGMDGLSLAVKAGCDYVETSFTSVARMSDDEFAAFEKAVAATGLKVEAMNGFIPGDYPLCTLEDYSGVLEYVRGGMQRGQKLGTQVVVFGSGAARRIPEGMDKAEALKKLAVFLGKAADIAAEYGIRIAVEPLCYAECNAVNTVLEGWNLARSSGEKAMDLADLYHMGQNGEDMNDIVKVGKDLIHCHIGRPGTRKYPMENDGYDYKPFFSALKAIGYEGRISVEAGYINSPEDIIASIAFERTMI